MGDARRRGQNLGLGMRHGVSEPALHFGLGRVFDHERDGAREQGPLMRSRAREEVKAQEGVDSSGKRQEQRRRAVPSS